MRPTWTAIVTAACLGLVAGLWLDAIFRYEEGVAKEPPGQVVRRADVTMHGPYSDARSMRWSCVEVKP